MLTIEDVKEALKDVVDPEIGLSVVDLGLIYKIDILNDGKKVAIDMTLTVRGCPLQFALQNMAQKRLLQIPGVEEAEVRLVWDPPWNPSMISPEAKKRFGIV